MIGENFQNCKVKQTLGTPGDQNYVCSNNNLLKKHFKYKKFVKLKDGLRKFVKIFHNLMRTASKTKSLLQEGPASLDLI